MTIWNYETLAKPFDYGHTANLLYRYTCLYCKSLMEPKERVSAKKGDDAFLKRCNTCGWWYLIEIEEFDSREKAWGGFARLKELDLNDLTIPTDEARIYLLAQYEKRNQIHPRLFEHTVASIMQGLGYKTRVTAYQGDNGIDIYLDGPNDTLVGIQVKRWNRSISIEQIHSLGGALIVNGCTEGIFVATSSFQRGAIANAKRFTDITGIPIKLVDAKKLYDALKITSSPTPLEARDPSTPWNICERPKLWS